LQNCFKYKLCSYCS